MGIGNEIAEMVFRRSPGTDLSAHKSDLQTFNILLALDGKRTLGTIAKEDFYELEMLAAKIEQMLSKGLIESSSGAAGSLEPSFFNQLTAELTQMVGPVAGLLVKESAVKLGHDTNRFPPQKVDALLTALGNFIQDGAKASEFKRRMRSLAGQRG
jgi:hypothetical protein